MARIIRAYDGAAPGPMPETVEPVVEDPRWEAAGIPAVAERAARAALAAAGRDPDQHEVGLLLCDDAKMAELNGAVPRQGRSPPTS